MKKTSLALKDNMLLEKLIAKYGKLVTVKQIETEARRFWDYQQTHNRIQQLVKNGWLIRIKRGLYTISELSSRGFLTISPYVIANLLVEESYVSFEAALNYHSMFDQFTDQYISISQKQYNRVSLAFIQYRFIKTKKKLYTGWENVIIENLTAKIALPEKTLVDIIHFHKSKYAVDLVIEKLQDHESDLCLAQLCQFASLASFKTIKIFGLIFDLLGFDSTRLHQLIEGKRSSHFMKPGDKTFNAKWRLYYDSYFDKYQRGKNI